jgi:hypothetical protein
MKPLRAFLFSFSAGLFALFGTHSVLSQMLVPTPDVQVGPINVPTA